MRAVRRQGKPMHRKVVPALRLDAYIARLPHPPALVKFNKGDSVASAPLSIMILVCMEKQ